MLIAAALIAVSVLALIAAFVAPAFAYVVRHPYAAGRIAYGGGVAHPYAAYRVARGAAVGAAVVGAAATGAYYSGYTQPYYDSGYGTNYSNTGFYAASPDYSYNNTGYAGGHVLGCGIGNWRCSGYGTNYGTNYGTGYSNTSFYAASPSYSGHVLGCGVGNWRCSGYGTSYSTGYSDAGYSGSRPTFDQAWQLCTEALNRSHIPKDNAGARQAAGAGCMQRFGYSL
jgi:hypothetical protein